MIPDDVTKVCGEAVAAKTAFYWGTCLAPSLAQQWNDLVPAHRDTCENYLKRSAIARISGSVVKKIEIKVILLFTCPFAPNIRLPSKYVQSAQ